MTNELRVQGSFQACWLIGNSKGGDPNTGPVSNAEFYSSSEYNDDDATAKIRFKFHSLSQNYWDTFIRRRRRGARS